MACQPKHWIFRYPVPIVLEDGTHEDTVSVLHLVMSEERARRKAAEHADGLVDIRGAPVDRKKFLLVQARAI